MWTGILCAVKARKGNDKMDEATQAASGKERVKATMVAVDSNNPQAAAQMLYDWIQRVRAEAEKRKGEDKPTATSGVAPAAE